MTAGMSELRGRPCLASKTLSVAVDLAGLLFRWVLRLCATDKGVGGSLWVAETVLKSMHLIITGVCVLLAGCAEPDKRGVADAQGKGNSFADSQFPPPVQTKLPLRRGQGVPTGRYGRPASRTALERT